MTKKNLNIALIPMVVFLWALIIYRIIGYTRPVNSDNTIQPIIGSNDFSTIQKDTIILYVNYKDPFIPFRYRSKKSDLTKITPIKKRDIIKPAWPSIEYGGIIENSDKDTTFAIIKINNQPELLTYKDEIAGMKIIFLDSDSIQIRFQNETKTYKKPVK